MDIDLQTLVAIRKRFLLPIISDIWSVPTENLSPCAETLEREVGLLR